MADSGPDSGLDSDATVTDASDTSIGVTSDDNEEAHAAREYVFYMHRSRPFPVHVFGLVMLVCVVIALRVTALLTTIELVPFYVLASLPVPAPASRIPPSWIFL
jgi:hypothetical protein